MALKDIFIPNSGTKKVLFTVVLITLSIIAGSWYYYRTINRSYDPRVIQARKMNQQFKPLTSDHKFDEALALVDRIKTIYANVPGYEGTFEMGVIYNNRASVYLTRVETEYLIQKENIIPENIVLYLQSARKWSEKAMAIYTAWMQKVDPMSEADIRAYVLTYFDKNDPAFDGYNFEKLLAMRVREIMESKIETPRRMSVTLSNLGIISRYEEKPDEAAEKYKAALELWPENYIAQNNLRILYGKKIQKRRLVDQMFPKERVDTDDIQDKKTEEKE